MESLQKESEWEKNLEGELYAYLGAMNMLGVMDGETTDGAIRLRDESVEKIMKSVRKRIAKAVSNREKEIAEEVERLRLNCPCGKFNCHGKGNDDALDEVLSILKH